MLTTEKRNILKILNFSKLESIIEKKSTPIVIPTYLHPSKYVCVMSVAFYNLVASSDACDLKGG